MMRSDIDEWGGLDDCSYIQMSTKYSWWIGCVMLLLTLCGSQATVAELQEEIANTEELVLLYQEKLELLRSILSKIHPSAQASPVRQLSPRPAIRTSPQLVLLSKRNHSSLLFQDRFLLEAGKILELRSDEVIAEYLGSVLAVEENALTTLVGGKVGLVEVRVGADGVKKQEQLLGLKAEEWPTAWHRNYNIKDGQDLLVQWQDNTIYFRGRQVRQITLDPDEQILAIYSLTQYKVLFVSALRVGIINSRALQLGDSIHVNNITRIRNSTASPRIRQSQKIQGNLLILLSTGELASYSNQKIISVQMLAGMAEELDLQTHSLYFQLLPPYLFVADLDAARLRVFIGPSGRFHPSTQLDLPFAGSRLALFREKESIRLFISSNLRTELYELLLPIVEEPPTSTNYFKFIGIFIVVLCFVYYKWVKGQNSDQKEDQDLRQLKEEKRRAARPPINRQGLVREGLNRQVQQFLRKQKAS